MVYVPAGKPVVVQVNGLVPYAPALVQVNVTGLYTQSWYSGVPEPPEATAVKETLGLVKIGQFRTEDTDLYTDLNPPPSCRLAARRTGQ